MVNAKFIKPIKLVPLIQNIVATIDVENQIDLKNLSSILPRIIYEPDQFPGAIFRTSQGPVCLIFSTGKVVIAGSKSEEEMLECANNTADMLKEFCIIKLDKIN